jgi:hypothetical protein
MSQGTHPPDTVWCVVEPDMCMYKIDAAARLELVQARMPEEKFADYESFAESIEDPKAKATFLESLEKWRDHQSVAGIQHAPWPAAATSEPSPHVLPPWRRSQVPKRAPPKDVPVLDKADKASSEKTKMNQISEELLDLVLYFNAACRCGRKGLLWCGWNASQWTETKEGSQYESSGRCSLSHGQHGGCTFPDAETRRDSEHAHGQLSFKIVWFEVASRVGCCVFTTASRKLQRARVLNNAGPGSYVPLRRQMGSRRHEAS